MMALRFMDAALWRMPLAPRVLARPLGTDGYQLYVGALRVVEQFRADPNEAVRDLLHAILHCVFRHPFDDKHPDQAAWDVACDVAVEAIALELVGLRYPSNADEQRKRALAQLKKTCPQLTAHKIYRAITGSAPGAEAEALGANASVEAAASAGTPNANEGTSTSNAPGAEAEAPSPTPHPHAATVPSPLSPEFVDELARLFARDDHSPWTRRPEQTDAYARVGGKAALIEDDGTSKIKGDYLDEPDADEPDDPDGGTNMDGAAAKSAGGPAAEGSVENGDRLSGFNEQREFESLFGSMDEVGDAQFDNLTWKDISKQIESELEGFPGKIGSNPETFLATLAIANRKTYDYKDFLRRFSSMSEEMKTSTEEFDYVYYTYGLKLYKNMPLVEPLEYQESNRVRDFVIAVDTSGSCAGRLVRKFVEKTYDVLKSSEGFGRKLNVHIIQCDCDVRKDVKITSLGDMDDGWDHFDVRGFGGTDFRPVFKYVDEMIERREFTNLKGLIYFTDGYGKYPTHPPSYETVFAFVDDSGRERSVPPWAMKVILGEDEIYEL